MTKRAIMSDNRKRGSMSRTIGEIAGELGDLIDEEYKSHNLWDEAFSDSLNPHSSSTQEQLQKKTYEATRIHGEVVDRINGIINELTNMQYVDRNSPPDEVRKAEARMEAQRKRLERHRLRG